MKYKDILRHKPWLRLVNSLNITNRLHSVTNNAFIVYNTIQQTYELHTLEAYYLSGDSYNTTIDLELLNGFLIHDYRVNDNKCNVNENISRRSYLEHIYDKHEETRRDLDSSLKCIERALGTKI